jgi:hypothetical protein
MISTGNDIVALAATDKERTCRYRYYSRIATPAEVLLYAELADGALDFSTFIWLLWSIKESVYKLVSRSNPRLVFAPLQLPVDQVGFRAGHIEGMVRFGQETLYSRSFLRDGTIMTVVSQEKDFAHTRWGVHAIGDPGYASQAAGVREFALQSLSAILPGAALRIVKDPDGPPEVWDANELLNIPISFAHHDRYVAWSYRFSANSSSYRKAAAN